MSHTLSSYHNVSSVRILEESRTELYRWQNIEITMEDGSLHRLSIFFAAGVPALDSAFVMKEAPPAASSDNEEAA